MVGVLWGIAILLVILWVLGKLVFGIASALIHLLLVVAVVVVVYNVIKAGASRRI
jgi:predicted lipid-binding transport protein (Tim44 family)